MKKLFFLMVAVTIVSLLVYYMPLEDKTARYSFGPDLPAQIAANVPSYTPIEQIPEELVLALVAMEDRRFFEHHGFDLIGIGRALFKNAQEGRISEGGSTITQQLAKNLFLTHERTLDRKAKELVFALKLETAYTKEEIMEMYLNVIYFGEGAFGVQNASQEYFHKNVWELTMEESAMLVGIVQAPSYYNPRVHAERAKERQRIVFERLQESGLLKGSLAKLYM